MKKILTDKRVIVVALVIILVLLLIDFNQRMVLLSRLRKQENQLEQAYSQLEATRSALQTELAFAGSDDAVERWAREEGAMVQEGDIPIVLLPPSEPIATAPTPQEVIINEVQNWQIWEELFFGD
jgi:cell division protein FtsB